MAIHQLSQARRLALRSRRWNSVLLIVIALPMLLFVLLPLMSLLIRTRPVTLAHNLLDSTVMQAVGLSLMSSTLATLLAVVVGTPLAYLLARCHFRGRSLIETLTELPMVLPPAVAGVALLMAFGRQGVVGSYLSSLGVDIAFSQTAVILAQLFVAAPFYVKSAITGLSRIEQEVEQAAAIDGARPLGVFWHVTLPLAWPALSGGAVMTWARALGEFGATIIFAGNFPGRTQTMPLAIYIGFEIELDMALTLAVILLTTSFVVLVIIKGVLRQRVGSI